MGQLRLYGMWQLRRCVSRDSCRLAYVPNRLSPPVRVERLCDAIASHAPTRAAHWTCEHCQTDHDRDINAAINLRDEGLRILTSGTGDKACRPDVSRSNRGRKKSTTALSVGQEAYTVP